MFHWQLEILRLEDTASTSLVILNINIFFSFLHNKEGTLGISDAPKAQTGSSERQKSHRKCPKLDNDLTPELRITELHPSGLGSGIRKFSVLFLVL